MKTGADVNSWVWQSMASQVKGDWLSEAIFPLGGGDGSKNT